MSFLSSFQEDFDTGNRFSVNNFSVITSKNRILCTCDGEESAREISDALNQTAEIDAICEEDDLELSEDYLYEFAD